jgi:outer membrane protein OmpA-like peptidoglycan-associated protein
MTGIRQLISTWTLTICCLLGPALTSHPVLAEDACAPLLAAFEAGLQSRNIDSIAKSGTTISRGVDCPVLTRAKVDTLVALAHVSEAERLAKQGATPLARLSVAEAGRKFAQPWQLLALLGDVRMDLKTATDKPDYVAACKEYQAAISAVKDPKVTPVPPRQAEIDTLLRKGDQTMALGQCPMGKGRAIGVGAIPVPVQFQFNADLFNELGQAYAADAARILSDAGRPKIKVVGHTDQTGSDAHNDQLSVKRAQAFKNFLVAGGYDAKLISVAGFGKRRPVQIEEPERFSPDETDQMLRRVEICFADYQNPSETCK